MRPVLVRLHRILGLSTAVFLALAGLTGSLLAFKPEIEAAINPQWFQLAAPPERPLLDPFALHRIAEQTFPASRIDYISFPQAGLASKFYLWPKTTELTQAAQPDVDEVFFDPYTGAYLGGRKWGAIIHDGRLAKENIVPFIWRLHEAIALPHPWGKLLMGVIALLWTLDCFVGLILTLPQKPPWLHKWKTAWQFKTGASFFRTNLDIHRIAGLYLWGLLLIFAWSSVMLNLDRVYKPAMALAFDFRQPFIPANAHAPPLRTIGWQQAHDIGRAALSQQDASFGMMDDSLWYRPGQNVYLYRTRLDPLSSGGRAQASVWIDASTGAPLATKAPDGDLSGDTVSEWLKALHVGQVFGWPYRVLIAIVGLALCALSATGVVIWWKKRTGRRQKGRQASPAPLKA